MFEVDDERVVPNRATDRCRSRECTNSRRPVNTTARTTVSGRSGAVNRPSLTRARSNATLGPEGERVNFWGARAASFVVPLGLGLLLGLIGPIAEHWGGRPGAAVGAVFSGGWPWACYAFLMGYFRRSKIESVVLAPLGLAIGVVTYYLTKGYLASWVDWIPQVRDHPELPSGVCWHSSSEHPWAPGEPRTGAGHRRPVLPAACSPGGFL